MSDRVSLIDRVVVQCTAADPMHATLTVDVTLAGHMPAGVVLVGAVRGPYSEQSRTLPAEFALRDAGHGRLEATLVDPCYSTDDLNMVYRVEVRLQRGAECIASAETQIELRQGANSTGNENVN